MLLQILGKQRLSFSSKSCYFLFPQISKKWWLWRHISAISIICLIQHTHLLWHFNIYALINFMFKVKVTQSCLTLCNPMDYTVHGILQAMEWVAFPFSKGSSRPRNWTWVSCVVGRCFTIWATREAHSLWNLNTIFFQTPSQQRKKTSSAKSEPCSSAEKTSSEPKDWT